MVWPSASNRFAKAPPKTGRAGDGNGRCCLAHGLAPATIWTVPNGLLRPVFDRSPGRPDQPPGGRRRRQRGRSVKLWSSTIPPRRATTTTLGTSRLAAARRPGRRVGRRRRAGGGTREVAGYSVGREPAQDDRLLAALGPGGRTPRRPGRMAASPGGVGRPAQARWPPTVLPYKRRRRMVRRRRPRQPLVDAVIQQAD